MSYEIWNFKRRQNECVVRQVQEGDFSDSRRLDNGIAELKHKPKQRREKGVDWMPTIINKLRGEQHVPIATYNNEESNVCIILLLTLISFSQGLHLGI